MLVSASTYPWDVARLGVDAVIDDLLAHGIEMIDLASTYHPIDAFSPRDGAFFTSPRGTFPSEPSATAASCPPRRRPPWARRGRLSPSGPRQPASASARGP
jgi:hypothetical protein